ncbi:ATP-binding cassette domain-containing protein [Burkholderia thailandensis]|uniref:ABC transporter family protein n=1 Tax=Burkholderia thailandensis TaxID=57975 RepID=A0AAW9D719_BURTH|nr:ATP-binding cassette domain-containing protein [Burkholderia thailandensis]AHI63650.1 ABC transporter family protein [Burkholderia thailandensis H0587]AIP63131.1 Aliphatic sulfonates import ATP-binding protein SsuB [Burkholderia thailandensis]AJY29720.1 ABC transporter family protein [Burkholderia thailandensis 34]AOI52042.1 aliphatic sulfonate ABC transporter ATP-binding protein [Burkholderia thailandensis]AOJ51043.1 aliphatic sulfonate ABC transporter ATP-binding protein [Burkholderia tha
MTGTSLAATYGPIAGADLEAELAQPRTADGDAQDAAVLERDGGAHALPFASGGAFGRAPRDDDDERRGAGDASVRLTRVSKRYGERTVLADVDLAIERGGFVSIVGRSGCGKSTLLRLVAELETPSAGTLVKRGDGGGVLDTRIMYQDARLLPWKTVLQNVMLGLGRRAKDDARAVLDEVGLLARAHDWPAQLSGGQRQRVALARALVHRPQLLLLDEPLGALDALTRIEMHGLIERLWREHRFTALLVTHDVQEAVSLADRILLIEAGRIAFDQPVPLERPRARASAAFAALEDRVLQRVLTGSDPAGATSAAASAGGAARGRAAQANGLRWAV